MPLTQVQIQAAQAIQHAAAHDQLSQVRIIAGPGTGKSSTIEERVRWLLANGTNPAAIAVLSFTRASALDLRQRVHSYCGQNGQPTGTQIRVSTIHSLALRTLRAAGLLNAYPADPLVMDSWELETVFDAEFGIVTGLGKARREQIRLDHEAFWSTGQWSPANYIPPNPPISGSERNSFSAFHSPRTQSYSCVLPGELVRECVTRMLNGLLDPVALLGLEHLVVDEYQDLNPMDLQFVDGLAAQGAHLFVCGDDDQSIYSFRFASPEGIQQFVIKYPHCGQHVLMECFRCTPAILSASQALIAAYAQPNRVPKQLLSLYSTASPPVAGLLFRWKLLSGAAEATAIAESCRDLIAAGVAPRDILVLVGNKRQLIPPLTAAFDAAGVAFEPPETESFATSDAGRWLLALVRVLCNRDDYVAHRVLLGLRRGVGIGTCNAITETVIANNLNYQSIFYHALPHGVFIGRSLAAVTHVRGLCAQILNWQSTDTNGQRVTDLQALAGGWLTPVQGQAVRTFMSSLPADMTLEEVRDFLWADSDEQQESLLRMVLNRLSLPIPAAGLLPARIRMMTMHGAKGLSAKVVFIPGLEEQILPGPRRQPYPGLVLEAARLLYVSLTRARAACIVSLAQTRIVFGQFGNSTPSRFATALGGLFVDRTTGLSAGEVHSVVNEIAQM